MIRTTLDKFFEADDVAVKSGGTPGSDYQDYSLASGERWIIEEFGGSASIDQTEVELLYSEDNGSTFENPFDSNSTKIRCIHLQNGGTVVQRLDLTFIGGTNRILRILVKNYNSANTAEITGFVRGQIGT